mmetsp:Transcript_10954/g.26338  ORF Transcript_10954/g.26338 Transcript_10954/m.26338 type:complete len:88 (+) Transcript_10954:796-1059(+)
MIFVKHCGLVWCINAVARCIASSAMRCSGVKPRAANDEREIATSLPSADGIVCAALLIKLCPHFCDRFTFKTDNAQANLLICAALKS